MSVKHDLDREGDYGSRVKHIYGSFERNRLFRVASFLVAQGLPVTGFLARFGLELQEPTGACAAPSDRARRSPSLHRADV